MKGKDFCSIRKNMGKTQKQMSEILGVSLKAIQSFEQGWRRSPAHVERQTLFVLAMKMGSREQGFPCWKIRPCSRQMRDVCPACEGHKRGQPLTRDSLPDNMVRKFASGVVDGTTPAYRL